MARKRR